MFVIALVAFAWVAANHRRLDEWIEKFIIWMEIKSDQLARMTLNWSSIPEPTLPDPPSKKPLEIDLDITGPHSLHQLIDIAVSREGSQLLAKWLSQEVPNLNLIREHQRVVRELTPLTRFRERLLLTFRLISREPMEGGKLLGWLKEETPSQKLKWLLPIAAILVATNITLFLLNSFGRLPAYWIISLSIYLGFYYYQANTINKFLEAIVKLDRELNKYIAVIRFLETYSFKGSENHYRCGWTAHEFCTGRPFKHSIPLGFHLRLHRREI
jgi:hypothetical protein